MMGKNRRQTRAATNGGSARFNERMYNRAGPPPAIEKVPFLGTTWYTRGVAYWFRRVVASILMLMALIAGTIITISLILVIVHSRAAIGVKIGALVVIALAIIYSFVQAFAKFFQVERLRKQARILRPNFDYRNDLVKRRRYGEMAGLLTIAVRAGSLLAGALLVISVIACFGWFVVMFIWTLQKEYGGEHDARLRLEEREARSRVV